MKKIVLSVLLVMSVISGIDAQRRNGLIGRRTESSGSVTFSMGPSFAFPDTQESPFLQSTYLYMGNFTGGFRYKFPNNLSVKGGLGFFQFSGSDGDYPRKYSFTSSMVQFTAQAEYAYVFGKKYGRNKPNSIYAFLGTGVMWNTAKLNTNGNYNSTYKYKSSDVAPVIPYGFGYQYEILNTGISAGIEVNFEYLFSDYLDGFKPPSPASSNNDVFEGISFTLAYKIF